MLPAYYVIITMAGYETTCRLLLCPKNQPCDDLEIPGLARAQCVRTTFHNTQHTDTRKSGANVEKEGSDIIGDKRQPDDGFHTTSFNFVVFRTLDLRH